MRGRDTMKIKKICLFFGILMLLLVCIASAETVKVAVKEAQGRDGPGSFYELKYWFPRGRFLMSSRKKRNWYKVKFSDMEVWISGNSLSVETAGDKKTSMARDPFKSFSMEDVSIKASSRNFDSGYQRILDTVFHGRQGKPSRASCQRF